MGRNSRFKLTEQDIKAIGDATLDSRQGPIRDDGSL
jgi:hypothetical protein